MIRIDKTRFNAVENASGVVFNADILAQHLDRAGIKTEFCDLDGLRGAWECDDAENVGEIAYTRSVCQFCYNYDLYA